MRLRIEISDMQVAEKVKVGGDDLQRTATLRNWKPGDRVRLRYSAGCAK